MTNSEPLKPFQLLNGRQQEEIIAEVMKINKNSSSKDVIYHMTRAIFKIEKYSKTPEQRKRVDDE